MTIEQELKQLEEIAKQLESSELPLEEAIALFEQGMKLAGTIRTSLSEAKLRIEQVIEKTQGDFKLEPLDID